MFEEIHCIEPAYSHSGVMNMAIDDLLLQEAKGVTYRFYEWARPTISIGYFGNSSEILSKRTEYDFVRRPTGGGLVEHGTSTEFTYSVVVSAEITKALKLRPRDSYRQIHGALVATLREFKLGAELAGESEIGEGGAACFVNPVGDDVMLEGTKIAGAGQKRSRGAILHQGSVQSDLLPPVRDLGSALANLLAEKVTRGDSDPAFLARANVLAEEKYGADSWNFRR